MTHDSRCDDTSQWASHFRRPIFDSFTVGFWMGVFNCVRWISIAITLISFLIAGCRKNGAHCHWHMPFRSRCLSRAVCEMAVVPLSSLAHIRYNYPWSRIMAGNSPAHFVRFRSQTYNEDSICVESVLNYFDHRHCVMGLQYCLV